MIEVFLVGQVIFNTSSKTLDSSRGGLMKSARWIVREMRIKDVFQWVVTQEKSGVIHSDFSDRRSAHDFAYYLNSSQK